MKSQRLAPIMKMVATVNVKAIDMKVIRNELTHEERMQARIDALVRDLYSGDANLEYIEQILTAVYLYMAELENDDIYASAHKIKEGIFYLSNLTQA
jgi:hypothetical protein